MNRTAAAKARHQRTHTRAVYDKYPYPASSASLKGWALAPMPWITTVWRPGKEDSPPERILVAGCGTGSEAFMLAQRFPGARIIAVDFSARSIVIARKLQKRSSRMRNIRFLQGDLTDPGLARATGGDFDFVTCHGVLSYIPGPQRALRNLARLLRSDGALFLGVNGAEHFSQRGRKLFPQFGFDMNELKDERRVQRLVDLWQKLLSSENRPLLGNRTTPYLACDLFGALIHNWTLDRWTKLARSAGLSLSDNYSSFRKRRMLMEDEHYRQLWPRSRANVSLLLDLLLPDTFHRLLFVKGKVWNPPWEDHEALMATRPVLSSLYQHSISRARGGRGLTPVSLKSWPLNTRLDWKIPAWEAEILRQADGRHTLREILRGTRGRPSPKLLSESLYCLYQLLVLTPLS